MTEYEANSSQTITQEPNLDSGEEPLVVRGSGGSLAVEGLASIPPNVPLIEIIDKNTWEFSEQGNKIVITLPKDGPWRAARLGDKLAIFRAAGQITLLELSEYNHGSTGNAHTPKSGSDARVTITLV